MGRGSNPPHCFFTINLLIQKVSSPALIDLLQVKIYCRDAHIKECRHHLLGEPDRFILVPDFDRFFTSGCGKYQEFCCAVSHQLLFMSGYLPVASTIAISASVNPYNSYTSLSIAASVASNPNIITGYPAPGVLGAVSDHSISFFFSTSFEGR